MITIKSNREIKFMREAGRIVALAHETIKDMIRPGISTYDIDQIVEKVIREHNATPSFKGYGGFPGSACTSINEEVVHGIPSKNRILKDGDIIKVDIGANYKGYHGDSAWTYPVGKISEKAQKLLEVTEASLFEGLKYARSGNRLSDISHAIQTYAESQGFSIVREFVGHGIGKNLHEDPQIPNYGLPNKGTILKPGMTLAIEPMVNVGRKEVKVLEDQWTAVTVDGAYSAHYEHTILITEEECILLTVL
ncbi:type I methionyl aminopeptidase [Liberiplasma polymorphum]|uniref:type I methionyl aminopeptidase n=1 Tax=Liberiplasma polymorphum TaxID=3374570 RepID=UPI003770A90A